MAETYRPTAYDIVLAKQTYKQYLIKVEVLNRDFVNLGTISGEVISCNINIDTNSDERRSCSLTIKINEDYDGDNERAVRKATDFNNLIRLKIGIIDNSNNKVTWYNQGIFVLNQNSYVYNAEERTLSLSACDLIALLNGRRGGAIGNAVYQGTITSGGDIQRNIIALLELGGISDYNIGKVGQVKMTYGGLEDTSDITVPYDIVLSTGSNVFNGISELCGLYPYWKPYFDINGTFVVEAELFENDTSSSVIDNEQFQGLVIDEQPTNNFEQVKNRVEIYGKDGEFYGFAEDNIADSPYQITSSRPQIYIETKDTVISNEECENWAKYYLYKYCRMFDTITITTTLLPFLNDAGGKVSYFSKTDNKLGTFVIKNISHDFGSCITTIELIRFYSENCIANQPQLETPVISASVNGVELSVTIITPSPFATKYAVYSNKMFLGFTTGATFSYNYDEHHTQEGSKNVVVAAVAMADGFQNSVYSNEVGFGVIFKNYLLYESYDTITSEDGNVLIME